MKLWFLKRRQDLPSDDDPWSPEQDKNHGLIVRAASEERARRVAQNSAADERDDAHTKTGFAGQVFVTRTFGAWLDQKYSTCEELTAEGEEGVIIIDHLAS